jgi:hypothetical protein
LQRIMRVPRRGSMWEFAAQLNTARDVESRAPRPTGCGALCQRNIRLSKSGGLL